jgi:proteasome assembly chaperone (PAC2) family protein
MDKEIYKFGWSSKGDIVKRFLESGYNVDPLFSWWLPKPMAYLGEQLILSVIKKDFYTEEQYDGITEMRRFTGTEQKYITKGLYDVRTDFLSKFPEYDVDEPWKKGYVKLYFVRTSIDSSKLLVA